jgi:hypothetical protein
MMKNEMKKFTRLAIDMFTDTLAERGFKRESKRTDAYSCNIFYGKEDRYVMIRANIHPRDYPPHFNIILGEGSREFPESDWNSVALWRVKNLIEKSDRGAEYGLEEPNAMEDALAEALSDLLKFGESFLSGELKTFRQARSAQNKNRPPYQVHSPDKDGKYTVRDDPSSAKLKEEYS